MKKIAIVGALIMVQACYCLAQTSQKIGDWSFVRSDESGMSVANTASGSGSILGLICVAHGDTCGPYISLSQSCEENTVYPILVNSPIGAFHTTTTCTKLGDGKYFIISDASSMNKAFGSGGEIGVAFPLQDGKFQVTRFSTAGAIAAIKEALSFQRQKKNTKLRPDETL